MDFNRQWTAFALDAEVEHFGTSRIAAAHNALRAEVERLRAQWHQSNRELHAAWAERDALQADAARYLWLKTNARRIDFAGLCVSDMTQLDARIDAALGEKRDGPTDPTSATI